MRASHLVFSLAISLSGAGVLGCGGSDPSTPDARPPVDAFLCAQHGLVNVPAPIDFSQSGQAPGRVPSNGTQLAFTALIFNNAAPTTGFLVIQSNNAGVFSAAPGKAGRFEKPPTPGVYPMDTEANFGFGIQFINGITRGGGSTTINPTQVALLDPAAGGTVQIDSWAPAAMPGMTSTLGATITNAKFKGFNVVGGTNLDPAGNGCDVTIQKFQFTGLTVSWQTAAFPPAAPAGPPASLAPAQPGYAAPTLDGAAVASADFRIE